MSTARLYRETKNLLSSFRTSRIGNSGLVMIAFYLFMYFVEDWVESYKARDTADMVADAED